MELPLTLPFLPHLPVPPRCEKVKTMEVTSVSIQLEKNFSNFPRQYFALRKILKQLIGELFPKGKEQRAPAERRTLQVLLCLGFSYPVSHCAPTPTPTPLSGFPSLSVTELKVKTSGVICS